MITCSKFFAMCLSLLQHHNPLLQLIAGWIVMYPDLKRKAWCIITTSYYILMYFNFNLHFFIITSLCLWRLSVIQVIVISKYNWTAPLGPPCVQSLRTFCSLLYRWAVRSKIKCLANGSREAHQHKMHSAFILTDFTVRTNIWVFWSEETIITLSFPLAKFYFIF